MAAKLALAPIPYYWAADEIHAFYDRVAHWPVDIVYLGEIICAKRRALGFQQWFELAQRLAETGKEIVLSTLALLEASSDIGVLDRMCNNQRFPVEANDMAAVQLLAQRTPFVSGPHINVYNDHTLALLAEAGAYRWVPPVELSAAALAQLQAIRPAGLETEVYVFGRLPLAFSARCFTARAHNVGKDQCGFCCADYPDGLLLRTQEEQPLFTLNGIQLQSGVPCNLLAAVPHLTSMGVEVLRIAPQAHGMEQIVTAFRAALDGELDQGAQENLSPWAPEGYCNGYWNASAGMTWLQ